MPLPLPNLDDRTFADLMEEAKGMIHGLYPDWTDYNPSDPGIMLVELLAWLTEMTMYRVNRVPDANYDAFLKLLNGKDWNRDANKTDLQTAIRETVNDLRQPYRAVTAEDYELLVKEHWIGVVKRAHCLPGVKVNGNVCTRAPGNVSLIIVPSEVTNESENKFEPSPQLLTTIQNWLDERRLLGVQHHVVGPDYVDVDITAELYIESGAVEDVVREMAKKRIETFFHPLHGGSAGDGWPLGREVFHSEVYELLDQVPGVDYVEDVLIDESRQVEPHQLVLVRFGTLDEFNKALTERYRSR